MEETPKSKDGEQALLLAVGRRLQPSVLEVESLATAAMASLLAERLESRAAERRSTWVGKFIREFVIKDLAPST